MTGALEKSTITSVSLSNLRRYLFANGFMSEGAWGPYLERFHIARRDKGYDVLLPTNNRIADYNDRMRDALRELAAAAKADISEIVNQVREAGYRPFRIRAHPGEEISSIPVAEGFALLENGKSLVKSAAVAAYSREFRPVIRGRSPIAVDEYMDRVQLGQSEVGSYVFTLLLPQEDELPLDDDVGTLGAMTGADVVARALEDNIVLAAEIAESKRVPSIERLQEAGVSANFCESLYNMVDWSENIILELARATSDAKQPPLRYTFKRSHLAVLERTAIKLAPEERGSSKTLSGTITRLNEPQIRRRGSIDLRVRIDGKYRSVRVMFDFEDRDTIITAFREKASRFLRVTGILKTERNGHLVLDEPHNFTVSQRGELV